MTNFGASQDAAMSCRVAFFQYEACQMKTGISVTLSLLMLAAVAAAGAAEIPTQKPGLWQMTVKSPSMPGGTRSFQICEDAAFLAAAKTSADTHLKKDCSPTSTLRKVGDTWVADSECTLSGIHIVSHSVTTIHGDDLYHTEASSTVDTPKGGKRTDVMSMENKWLGACKAGQKVGVPIAGR
jgi:hypothetical protein